MKYRWLEKARQAHAGRDGEESIAHWVEKQQKQGVEGENFALVLVYKGEGGKGG